MNLTELTLEEKVRLLSGSGSWHNYTAGGKLPQIMMTDGPHGLRKQEVEVVNVNASKLATCFPTASAIASSWNLDTVSLMARTIAKEALKEKVSLVLGCGTNIKRSPLCGRNFEYFSEDPYLAGRMAGSYIRSMESQGVGTSLKHFACNNQETHRMTVNSQVDERALHEIYLKPFEMAVKEGNPASLMASYNLLNGEHATASKYLLQDVLRGKWGYKGAVISDWGAAVSIADCIKNGMNLEMPDSGGFNTQNLMEALSKGLLSEADIDKAVTKVIEMVEKYAVPEDAEPVEVDYEQHHQIARQIAEDCAVLLKHEGAFPISKTDKVLIMGDMAVNMRIQGGGSSHINCPEKPGAFKALEAAGCDVTFASQVPSDINSYDKIIYFCGLTDKQESEGYDRESLNLEKQQINQLAEILSKAQPATKLTPATEPQPAENGEACLNEHSKAPSVSLVTFGGSPFIVPYLDQISDVLHMHLAGQAAGEACARLLMGEAVPSGKLSETYPLSIEDTPCYGFWGKKSDNANYVESVFVGYRYYETFDMPVQFEFGYGLSYTDFAYDNFKVEKQGEKVLVSFDLTNTGSYAGAEVSQVYVVNPQGDVIRPKKELKGFVKTLLAPGECKCVEIQLDEDAFSVYDKASGDFVTIVGEYGIAIGSSSRDIHHEEKIQVEGALIEENQREMYPEYFSGEFTADGFQKLYGKELLDLDSKKPGDYTIYDSFNQVCSQFFAGRCILKLMYHVIGFIVKAPKDDPAFLMTYYSMVDAPLTSLCAFSGGRIKMEMIRWMVKKANRG